jgi:hypothetical protein
LLLLDRSGGEERLMTVRDAWAVVSLLAAFDEHLRRRRGLASGTLIHTTTHHEPWLPDHF